MSTRIVPTTDEVDRLAPELFEVWAAGDPGEARRYASKVRTEDATFQNLSGYQVDQWRNLARWVIETNGGKR